MTSEARVIVETEGRLNDARSGQLLVGASGLHVAADERRKHELRQRDGWRALDAPDPVEAVT